MLWSEVNLGLERPARMRWQKKRLDAAEEWTGLERGCSEYRWILAMGRMRCPSKQSQNGRLTSLHELPGDASNFWVQAQPAVSLWASEAEWPKRTEGCASWVLVLQHASQGQI